jgi:hypothetical protein
MQAFTDASSALESFSQDGGAMNYIHASSNGGAIWQVGCVEDIADVIGADSLGVKDATRLALVKAGLSDIEVEKILTEWQD